MSTSIVAILYLISALLFIFALKGLSHPESSRRGNIYGIVGMLIAIITTLMFKSVLSYAEIGAAILVGGLVGTFIALPHKDNHPEFEDNDFINNHKILNEFRKYLDYGHKDVSADVEECEFDGYENVKWIKINNFKVI